MIDKIGSCLPSLERGTVHAFWFATDLPESQLQMLEHVLNDAERARADRFHFPRDRGRFIAARARLRTLLGHYAECAPTRLEFDTGPYGKPGLRQAGRVPRLQFNLSRSASTAVLAIGLDEELGVDVERLRPFGDGLVIAERMFTCEEHRALRTLPVHARTEAFFRYWTRKEAVVKRLGWGLSCPFDIFALRPDEGAEVVEIRRDGTSTVAWVQPVPAPHGELVAALASTSLPALRCWDWRDA
jgi:4'-phosphopantetheinyl transferase